MGKLYKREVYMAIPKVSQNNELLKPAQMVKENVQAMKKPTTRESSMMKSFDEAKKGMKIDTKA
jgi:hypothetical protein